MSTPRPAATVVLLRPAPTAGRDGRGALEVLLTRRPASMSFAPDVHVFPGGRVDPADADPRLLRRSVISADEATAALGGDLPPTEALAAYVAAIREAFEEVGVLLADHRPGVDLGAARDTLLRSPESFPLIAEQLELRLRTDQLVPLSRWVTPPLLARRFDARFFAALLPDDVEPSLVGEEVVEHDWYRPLAALESMAADRLSMWLPTSTTLAQLVHVGSIQDIRERMAPGRLGKVGVEVVSEDIVRIEMPAGGGVAGQPVHAYLIGHERCVLVDPGDPTGDGLAAAVRVVAERGGRIEAVVLTCAEPDHAAGAEWLREQLGVEVIVGPSGGRHLPYRVDERDDGASIVEGDVPLQVIATPGLEPEGLAIIVGAGQFAVTGDLDGQRGARSIFGPIDADALRASVARLHREAPSAAWLGGHAPIDFAP